MKSDRAHSLGGDFINFAGLRKPGEEIRVQPQLFTADGLLINSCSLGDSEEVSRYGNHKHCTVQLSHARNQMLDMQSSGFA